MATFDVQAALKAGYSQDQINQYLSSQQYKNDLANVSQPQIPEANQSSAPLGDLLINLAKNTVQPTTDIINQISTNPQSFQKNIGDYLGALGGPLGALLAGGNQAKKLLPAELNVSALATPMAPEAGLLKGIIAPGIGVGAMQRASEPGANTSNIIQSGAIGGAGAGILHSILGALGGLGGVGKTLEDTGTSLRKDVAKISEPASIYGATREKAVQNTLDNLGISGNAQQKYEQLLPAYQQLGTKIDNALSAKPIDIPIDTIRTDLMTNLAADKTLDLSGEKATNEVSKFLQNLYGDNKLGDSISTPDLFNLKQQINMGYGTIAKKIQNGTPLSDYEKVIAIARKTIDDIITEAHPDVKELTTMQSHLYDAAESLNKSRKTTPTLRIAGTTIPTSVQQSAQDLGGKTLQQAGQGLQNVSQTTNGVSQLAPALSKILSIGAGSSGNVGNNGQNENNTTQSNISQNNTTSNLNHTSNYITPEQVSAAQLYLPPAIAARVEAAYKAQTGGATMQQAGLVRAGQKSIDDVELMIKKDPNLLAKQLIPGQFASRQFDSALYDATDALLRLRTGAQANPAEIRGYMNKIAPTFGDDAKTIQYKLDKLRSDLNSYIGK